MDLGKESSHTFTTPSVPPAYGDFRLALVMHSNEGGPGPRHNMKMDPGTFTLIMRREHGCHLYLMPWFSESGDNRNRRMGLPPHQSSQDRAPSHPLSSTHPSPSQSASGGQPRRKHTLPLVQGQRPWIGQKEDEETIVSFSAAL